MTYREHGGRERCRRVRDLLGRKLAELDLRRRELDHFRDALREYLQMCERALAQAAETECPVVEDLAANVNRPGRR